MNQHDRNIEEVQRFLGIRPGTRQRRIGWFMVGLFILIFGAALIRGQNFGRKIAGMMVYATMSRGHQLKPGSPVLLKDVQVGEVEGLDLEHVPFRITLQMRIYPSFTNKIPEGTRVGVELQNILERVVVLTPPDFDTTAPKPKMVGPDAYLPVRENLDLVSGAQSMIDQVGGELAQALHEVNVFTKDLNDTHGDFRGFLRSMNNGAKDFEVATGELRKRINDRSSVAGVLLNDDKSAKEMKEIIADLAAITAQTKKATANLEKASQTIPELVTSADKTVKKFGDVADKASQSWLLGGRKGEDRGKNW